MSLPTIIISFPTSPIPAAGPRASFFFFFSFFNVNWPYSLPANLLFSSEKPLQIATSHKFSTANTDSYLIKTSAVFTSLVIFLRLDFTGPSLLCSCSEGCSKCSWRQTLPAALMPRVVSSALRRPEVRFCLFCISGRRRVKPRLFRGLPHWVCSRLGLPDYKLPAF